MNLSAKKRSIKPNPTSRSLASCCLTSGHLKNWILFAGLVGILGACSQNIEQSRWSFQKPELAPAEDVEQSFKVISGKGDQVILIHRSALDKEFLIQSNLITQDVVPMPNGLKSRVVRFQEAPGRLIMFESSDGNIVDKSLPQNLVLTSFPTADEVEGGWIPFDFNTGVSLLYVAGNWFVSDFQGSDYQPEFQAVPAIGAFLKDSVVDQKNNRISITQLAQIPAETGIMSVEVKYYLRPYLPDGDFRPVLSPGFDRLGFFEVSPRLENGESVVRASKFDENKPIRFSISENTPEHFRQALKDGVLYWNKAFGKEIVTADVAPKGVFAPSIDHNIVQWIPWDEAGFAYADAQMDPRTGEILNAQVFMTSVFAVSGVRQARKILSMNGRQFRNSVGRKMVSLAHFHSGVTCFRDMSDNFLAGLSAVMKRADVSDEVVLRFSQDYVREVVAHEIGHVLGLRHNFAGSLASTFDYKKQKELADKYIRDEEIDTKYYGTSTVMDYNTNWTSLFIGERMRRGREALPYDLAAIRYLYLGEDPRNIPPFCTDSQVGQMLDCQRFDVGRNLVESVIWERQEEFDFLSVRILNQVIDAKMSAQNRTMVFPTSADAVAGRLMSRGFTFFQGFFDSLRTVQIQQGSGSQRVVSQKAIQAREASRFIEQVRAVGIEQVSNLPNPEQIESTRQQTLRMIELLITGKIPGAEELKFTSSEVKTIQDSIDTLFSELADRLIRMDLAIWSGGLSRAELQAKKDYGVEPTRSKKMMSEELSDLLAEVLIAKASSYLLESGEVRELTIQVPAKSPPGAPEELEEVVVKMPVFRHSGDLRFQAANLIKDQELEGSLAWVEIGKRNLYRQVFEKIGQDYANLARAKNLSDPFALRWMTEQGKILRVLKVE